MPPVTSVTAAAIAANRFLLINLLLLNQCERSYDLRLKNDYSDCSPIAQKNSTDLAMRLQRQRRGKRPRGDGTNLTHSARRMERRDRNEAAILRLARFLRH
jgi:hypothetical protein